jgi:hypothetical protein
LGTSKNVTKETRAALAASLAAGVVKRFPAGSSLTVGGATLTLTQIATELDGFSALRADVETARATLQGKIAAETAQAATMNAFISALVKVVRGSFGNQPAVLADFGLEPTKARTPLTSEQKVAAAAKSAATRAARGTTGSKAKKAIKGNVTGVTVTPVTADKAAQPAAAASTAASTTATPPAHS